jgi:hypothetical protein
MCSCSCSSKGPAKPAQSEDNKTYVCSACNTFKVNGAAEAAPECCGKKMNEME